ncbi:MAG TPA: spondin domain-containing protein [Dehalococcoidia bacterium]|nr:spondin domain-containing protein [Dehalococcoidia bacterium]
MSAAVLPWLGVTRARVVMIGVVTAILAAAALFPAVGRAQTSDIKFRLTVTNATDPEMVVTPGAFLVHDAPDAFWSAGTAAPLSLERIAEIGNSEEAVGTLGAEAIGAAPAAGDSVSVEFTASPGQMLSLAQMLVATNDDFVGVNSLPLWVDGQPIVTSLDLVAWDAGTEDNEDLFAGFDGGQPDPAMGMANVENGTATVDGVVALSDQLAGTQATLTVVPIGETISVGAGLTLIGWTGVSSTSADFLADNPDVDQVFIWAGDGWLAYSPLLPDPLRTSITLNRGDGFFVVTETAVDIMVRLG